LSQLTVDGANTMLAFAEPGKTQADLKWSMFRVPVRVHPAFWLIALLLVYPTGGIGPTYPFSFVLIGIACIFVSILVHEYGHAFAARYYGERHNHIILYWLGGLCVHDREMSRWPRISTLLWGPGAGFVLAAIAFGIMKAEEHRLLPQLPMHAAVAVYSMLWINLYWGLMNLLPVFPLDGGQIAQELIRWKAPQRGDYFALTISFYTGLAAALGLALQSWFLRQQVGEFGRMGGGQEEPREPWEQDADWWKK
jgi:stage IV sporulation protein FB